MPNVITAWNQFVKDHYHEVANLRNRQGKPLSATERLKVLSEIREQQFGIVPKADRRPRKSAKSRGCTQRKKNICKSKGKMCRMSPKGRRLCVSHVKSKSQKLQRNLLPTRECTDVRIEKCLEKGKECHVNRQRISCRMTLEEKRAKSRARYARRKTLAKRLVIIDSSSISSRRSASPARRSASPARRSASPARRSASRVQAKKVIRRKTAKAIIGAIPAREKSSSPLMVPGAMQTLLMPQGVVELPEVIMPKPPRRSTRVKRTPDRFKFRFF